MNAFDSSFSATEYLASEAHAKWYREQWGKGIMSSRSELGEELMVPYESLTEPAKEIFRKQILMEKIFPAST